jgi:uroporphyrin-III C-methyltransferase
VTVYLVGAGPGDPGLLTLRAVELLRQCDVVVFDRLVSPEILAYVSPAAERIDVGKKPGDSERQVSINEILVDRGHRFECVVRLKGGDPHVFGRAAEELIALRSAGIAAVVVPGVSSALAAPAAVGIPLTTRLAASGFTVVTAHQDPATDRDLDWDALAKLGTTLVILMGAARARSFRDRLIAGGMRADMPVAIITEATTDTMAERRLTLAQLGDEPVPNPSVIVVGAVAALDLRTVLPTAPCVLSGAVPRTVSRTVPKPAYLSVDTPVLEPLL